MSESSGHMFKFRYTHFFWITDNPAFCSSVWQSDYGTLYRHPDCEGFYFVEAYVGVVSNSTFEGSEGIQVLDAHSSEDFDMTIVHPYGDGNNESSFGVFEEFEDIGVEFHVGCDNIELLTGHLVWVGFVTGDLFQGVSPYLGLIVNSLKVS